MTKWDDFEVFCHVAEQGGFTAAAKTLKIPKSSVSAAVSRLEKSLNVRLLERTTRVVRLTEAGDSLYSSVDPLFDALRDARDEALAYSKNISGTLRVAAPYEFSAHHLGAVACHVMTAHPQLRIQIDMEYAEISPLDERYDIVFSMVDRSMPSSSIIARKVFSLSQGLFASPRLFQSFAVPTHPDELTDLPILTSSTNSEWVFSDRKGDNYLVPIVTPRFRSSNANVRLQTTIAGLGISRFTATYCVEALDAGDLVQVLPDYLCAPRIVYALLPSRKLVPAKVRVFLDKLTGVRSQ